MYGTTMKNYGASKAYRSKKETKDIFRNKKVSKKSDAQNTRYMKINESKKNVVVQPTMSENSLRNEFSKKEFPIASVIFTAIITMLALLLGTGIIG